MKTENIKKENAGSMESLELTHSTRERHKERERERNTQKTIFQKTLTQYSILHVCVFNAHVLYKSLQGVIEVLSYFNAH